MATNTLNLLVVDQDPQGRDRLVNFLKPNHQVASTNSLEEAKNRLSFSNFDMLFVNLRGFPEDGTDFLAYLDSTGVPYKTAVVLLLDTSVPGYQKLCLDQGVWDYLDEPLNSPLLENRLAFILQKFQEHKKQFDDLWMARQVLDLVINHIPQAVFWKDKSSVYLGSNQVAADVISVQSPADIVGKTARDVFFSEEEADRFHESDLQVMETGQPTNHTIAHFCRQGEEHWLDTSKFPLFDRFHRVNGVLGIYDDITARKQAEESLRAKEKFERDVHIGREIQKNFLPSSMPELPDWEIASYFSPAREVAGDFYDAFPLMHGWAGFVIADVCDKGVGPAMFMALFRSLIRAFTETNTSLTWEDVTYFQEDQPLTPDAPRRRRKKALPAIGTSALCKGIEQTNNYIATNHGEANMFATTFFGVLDPATGLFKYINGGHEPPLLIDAKGNVKTRMKRTGMPIGIMPNLSFKINEIQFEPGDTFFAYTDGATDARTPEGELFSEERLVELVTQPYASVAELINAVADHLHQHISSADQFDDITLLALRWSPDVKEETESDRISPQQVVQNIPWKDLYGS